MQYSGEIILENFHPELPEGFLRNCGVAQDQGGIRTDYRLRVREEMQSFGKEESIFLVVKKSEEKTAWISYSRPRVKLSRPLWSIFDKTKRER